MKARRTVGLCTVILVLTAGMVPSSAPAQGSFQNLNFELANPGTIFSAGVPASSALTDWTVTIGGVQQTDVGVNAFSTGAPYVSLIAPGGPVPAIDGNYSVLLTGTFGESVGISQSGLIPAGTQSLFFEANNTGDAGSPGILELQVGTQVVPFGVVGTGPNYTLYGANISAWADDSEQLTFSALQDNTALNNWTIDDITFSTEAVPEPNTVELGTVAAALLGLRLWWKRGGSRPA